MNYILLTGADSNREVIALVQGPDQLNWGNFYKEFAEAKGLPYEENSASNVNISPGGANTSFFASDRDAKDFIDWLVSKKGVKKLPYQEHKM